MQVSQAPFGELNEKLFGSGFGSAHYTMDDLQKNTQRAVAFNNFIPSFSWGGNGGFTTYLTKKAFEVANIVMARRDIEFTEQDAAILEHVFEEAKKFRRD